MAKSCITKHTEKYDEVVSLTNLYYDENRLKPEKLFYGDIVGKTWEETKEQYLGEVGR